MRYSRLALTVFCSVVLGGCATLETTIAPTQEFKSIMGNRDVAMSQLATVSSCCRDVSSLPFQVTVVLGGGGVPCLRTPYATLQAVLRHCCGVAVVVGDKPFTGQEVVGAQANGVGFLAVGAFVLRLLLPCFQY